MSSGFSRIRAYTRAYCRNWIAGRSGGTGASSTGEREQANDDDRQYRDTERDPTCLVTAGWSVGVRSVGKSGKGVPITGVADAFSTIGGVGVLRLDSNDDMVASI